MVKLIDIVACMEEVKGMIQHVHIRVRITARGNGISHRSEFFAELSRLLQSTHNIAAHPLS